MSSPAKLLIAGVLLIFFVAIMYLYQMMLYPMVNITLANLALGIGVETAYVDFICMLSIWFPRIFLACLYVWAVVESYDTEEDTLRYME